MSGLFRTSAVLVPGKEFLVPNEQEVECVLVLLVMLRKRCGSLAPHESHTPQVYSLRPNHYTVLAATVMGKCS